MRSRRAIPVVCVMVAALSAVDARQLVPANAPEAQMIEVERLTAEGEWDRAIELLTGLIHQLTTVERSQDVDRQLVLAYERRAMARLQTGDETNARLDFAALLQRDPNHTIATASPGMTGLFAEVRKSTLGALDVAVRPADATITLQRKDALAPADAAPRTIGAGTNWLSPGIYEVSARRPGYQTVTHAFTASPGSAERRVMALQRTSAALFVSTSPAGVRVLVNGELRGTTEASGAGSMSSTLVIDGLEPRDTPHKIRFEKECFVPAADTFLLESLDVPVGTDGPDPHAVRVDRNYDVVLKPAFGRLEVVADQQDASVWIDGHRRGPAGQPFADVCEGTHRVDVRAPAGQFATSITIAYAKTTTVNAPLVPTFALMAAGGGPLDADLSARLVEGLRSARGVRLVVPDAAELESSKALTPAVLAQRLDVQGVATARRIPPDSDGHDVELSWLAAGASRGEVTPLRLGDAAAAERLVRRLDAAVPLNRPSIGIDVVDVLRVDGAVVSAVDPAGPANGLIKPGEIIVGIGVTPVAGAQDLAAALALSAGSVNVRIRERSDVVPVKVVSRPTVVNMKDPAPLFNEAVTELRARLARLRASAGTPDPAEIERLRVNLAASLMAVEGWTEADALLKDVAAGPAASIPAGTIDYLRGLAAKGLGRTSDARAHLERAARDEQAVLTEDGPLVAYLAKSELRLLAQPTR